SSQRAVRRRRQQRWLLALGAVALVVAAYSTQSYLAHRALAAEISDELQVARDARDNAHDAARARGELAAQASAAFDAGRRGDGERLWRQGVAQRDNAYRAFRNAITHTEFALAKDRTRSDVRQLAADILLDRAALADQVHDAQQRDELLEHVALYDPDGSRRARWDIPGHVIVRAPQGAAISLEPPRPLGANPRDLQLPRGSYVVAIAAPGRVPVRAPILVERGGELTIQVAPPRIEDVPAGFLYIPAGEFLYGNASDEDRLTFFATTPLRRRTSEAFLIGRTEVTFGDWLAYVDAQPPGERARLLPSVPSRLSGGVAITPDGAGRWRIELQIAARRYTAGWGEPILYSGRARQTVQDWRRFPVLGVSADEATAYAAWLDRTRRVPGARLCSEVEWERAGRGADGRGYPAGHPLELDDANIDEAHGQALKGPDEVGSHPASRSPFGLDDMSGNALEWTVSENAEEGYTLRGGSYWHDRKSAHITNRSYIDANVHDPNTGFRLCATPPLPR
ncbi:MAG TPA: SUMF1/EgtB/PvdO family nonheme iron enzyme, partial [Kofleriaceae bacterium]